MSLQLKDSLTGVYVREFMEETLAREVARSQRHERPLSIALASIDKLNEIEKQYGSSVTEQILAHGASRIQLTLRQSDSLICHWTKGEFLICLLECDLRGALSTLERIKSRISSEPFHILVHQIPVTICVGIASFRPDVKSETLIQEALHTLKQAKETGSNQIRSFNL